MVVSSLFDAFSRKNQESDKKDSENITMEFRNRVILLCVRTFSFSDVMGRPDQSFWLDIYDKIVYLYGKPIPSCGLANSPKNDVIDFLSGCEGRYFLDFVELIFKSRSIWDAETRWQVIVENINIFLQADNLPYYLTGFVFSAQQRISSYPRIIRRENDVLHDAAIEPTLRLLENPHFSSANIEFLEALTHFRKAEYPDCLSKCGSSIESVMKVICDRKGWQYNQNDTFSKLLSIIIDESNLEGFFRDTIMIVGTIRNRLSSAHGAGTQQRAVPKHKAAFAVNATASAILLLVDETNP